jgi:hypothetical protein
LTNSPAESEEFPLVRLVLFPLLQLLPNCGSLLRSSADTVLPLGLSSGQSGLNLLVLRILGGQDSQHTQLVCAHHAERVPLRHLPRVLETERLGSPLERVQGIRRAGTLQNIFDGALLKQRLVESLHHPLGSGLLLSLLLHLLRLNIRQAERAALPKASHHTAGRQHS